MYIHSVKLTNFKSIGNYSEAEIILEPRVTAIIGKNESGKSNILEGLSKIDFIKNNPAAFSQSIINRNNNSSDTENIYIITLKPLVDEIKIGLVAETKVTISKEQCTVTGGFLDYCKKNVMVYFEAIVDVLNKIGNNPFQLKDQDLVKYRAYKKELEQDDRLDLYRRSLALNFLYSQMSRTALDYKERLKEVLDTAKENWYPLLDMFPTFFYRNSGKHLKSSYKFEDIEKEVKNATIAPNSLLHDFVKLIGVSPEDFIFACKAGTTPNQETLRKRINRFINVKINKPFHDFYQTETISLDLSFNGGVISFMVQSEDGEALTLSERSNGLKWYLETFIDAQSNDIKNQNAIFLFDEPGISLHVNAQKELLHLFQHLAEKGNQVVYTTHSPYMLDLESEGIHRIRAVVKDVSGYSRVYKTAYDSRIAPESQQDTLAPIISAIGMNLNDTFGPAKEKINIVTEGMSDYIFLCTMAKVLNIDTEKYAIIPSVGASNCIHICSILHGWGCQYIALFDYDRAGVEDGGEFLRKNMFFEYKSQYCYMKDVTQEEVNQKTYKDASYMIEDVVTRDEIKKYCEETETSNSIGKTLMAKLMSNAVESGEYLLGEQCKTNFRELFNRIFSYFQN